MERASPAGTDAPAKTSPARLKAQHQPTAELPDWPTIVDLPATPGTTSMFSPSSVSLSTFPQPIPSLLGTFPRRAMRFSPSRRPYSTGIPLDLHGRVEWNHGDCETYKAADPDGEVLGVQLIRGAD